MTAFAVLDPNLPPTPTEPKTKPYGTSDPLGYWKSRSVTDLLLLCCSPPGAKDSTAMRSFLWGFGFQGMGLEFNSFRISRFCPTYLPTCRGNLNTWIGSRVKTLGGEVTPFMRTCICLTSPRRSCHNHTLRCHRSCWVRC